MLPYCRARQEPATSKQKDGDHVLVDSESSRLNDVGKISVLAILAWLFFEKENRKACWFILQMAATAGAKLI